MRPEFRSRVRLRGGGGAGATGLHTTRASWARCIRSQAGIGVEMAPAAQSQLNSADEGAEFWQSVEMRTTERRSGICR